MKVNKKIIVGLMLIVCLSWVGNVVFYYKYEIGDNIVFNYSYQESSWFFLSYVKDQMSDEQVVSISFPEIDDLTIPVANNGVYNILNSGFGNTSNESKSIVGNTRYTVVNIGILLGEGFYPSGKEFSLEDIAGKELTKIKYTTSSGVESECKIGGLFIIDPKNELNRRSGTDGVSEDCGKLYKCIKASVDADRVGNREYKAEEDIELYDLTGRYKDEFMQTYNIEVNGQVIDENFKSFKINKGEEFKVITKAESDSAINPLYGTGLELKVRKADDNSVLDKPISVGVDNVVNREIEIYSYKEVYELLKIRGIK